MENDVKEILSTLLVAQVLTLAKAMEADSNTNKSDHFIPDAIEAISQQRADILGRLAGTM